MIVVNNKKVDNIAGRNIVINNGKIIIDGVDVTPDSKQITIQITGNVDLLDVDVCEKITIAGEVGDIKTGAGDIECGNVKNDVSTASGDVKCNDVTGNVNTMSGDVKAKNISGKVSTMSGDIEYYGKP
jgi:hypothetical protein